MLRSLRVNFTYLGLLLLALAFVLPAPTVAQGRTVVALTYDGPVTPAMLSYLERGIGHAEEVGATPSFS